MVESLQYYCLGIEALGYCNYNPAKPITYFSIGEAASLLGFTLAIQQLLKPLFHFRLQSKGISFNHLSLGTFIAFIFVLIASFLPSISTSTTKLWQYPIFWEGMAALVVAIIYGVVAYSILRPTRIRGWNLVIYIRAAAKFLSEASDEERIKFAMDLSYNVKDLFKYAAFWEYARNSFVRIEMGRLASAGLPQRIVGLPPKCPFFMFANRKKINQSSLARNFLGILSDKKLCSVLVTDCPWDTARLLRHISSERLHTDAAEGFVQQIGLQAIVNDNSMMTRELGYEGFAVAPELSSSLFSDSNILNWYRPLSKVWLSIPDRPSAQMLKRLGMASEMMVETALEDKDYWGSRYIDDIQDAYENICRNLSWDKNIETRDYSIDLALNNGIRKVYTALSKSFPSIEQDCYESLYRQTADQHPQDIVHLVAETVYNHFECFGNGFEVSGKNWSSAIDTFMKLFPFHDSEPAGMTPLQQHLAIQILEKVDENINGYYPAVIRLMLALFGPYESHPVVSGRTAYVILKDSFFAKLKKLPALYDAKPKVVQDFLPSHITYDRVTNILTHTYSSGTQATTNLDTITPISDDLYSEGIRIPQAEIRSRY